MVSLTQELCPVAMRVAEGHNKMLSNVAERVTVPRNFIRGALLEQAGQDIQNLSLIHISEPTRPTR